MSFFVDPSGCKTRVKHVLADGKRVDDIDGHFIPYNEENAGIYHVLFRIIDRVLSEAEQAEGA